MTGRKQILWMLMLFGMLLGLTTRKMATTTHAMAKQKRQDARDANQKTRETFRFAVVLLSPHGLRRAFPSTPLAFADICLGGRAFLVGVLEKRVPYITTLGSPKPLRAFSRLKLSGANLTESSQFIGIRSFVTGTKVYISIRKVFVNPIY